MLAELLAPAANTTRDEVERGLAEREGVRSTGIGEGVAIPHCSVAGLHSHVAALVVHGVGVDFDSIDGKPAQLIMGVVGPSGGPTNHLKFLARVSRLFGNAATRRHLLDAGSSAAVISVVERAEGVSGG